MNGPGLKILVFVSQKKRKKRKKVNPATTCTAFSCFRLEALIKVTEDQEAPITPKEILFETVQSDSSLGQRNKARL